MTSTFHEMPASSAVPMTATVMSAPFAASGAAKYMRSTSPYLRMRTRSQPDPEVSVTGSPPVSDSSARQKIGASAREMPPKLPPRKTAPDADASTVRVYVDFSMV